jgi:hypothetical protein
MLDDIVAGIVGGLGSGAKADRIGRRRQRKADEDVAAGRAPVVFGAVRRVNGNLWRRRWRHGLLTVRPEEIAWRPRLRPWPRVELTGIRVQRRSRRPHRREWWSLAPDVWIYRIRADDLAEYELAVVSESRHLFEQQLGRRAWFG